MDFGGNAMQASGGRADPVTLAPASSCWRAAPGRQL